MACVDLCSWADITLARQNVMSIIKGSRSMPYSSNQTVEKQERKYGEFTMTFAIPHNYEVGRLRLG